MRAVWTGHWDSTVVHDGEELGPIDIRAAKLFCFMAGVHLKISLR